MAENIDAERAAPCPLCESAQVQVCRDANNPAKDYCRCRECKCTGPLAAWNRRTSASIGEDGLPSLPDVLNRYTNAGLTGYSADQMREMRRQAYWAGVEGGKNLSAPQAAQGVKTWQERAQEFGFSGRPQGYPDSDELEALKQAEIDDLRVQLAAKTAEADEWSERWLKARQLARQSQEPAARVERIFSINGLAEVSILLESALKVGTTLYAAPPLSSEPNRMETDGIGGSPSDSALSSEQQANHPASPDSSGNVAPAEHAEPSPMYFEALKIVREQQRASVSLVQRRMRISWNAARDMVELMLSRRDVPLEWAPPVYQLAARQNGWIGEQQAEKGERGE